MRRPSLVLAISGSGLLHVLLFAAPLPRNADAAIRPLPPIEVTLAPNTEPPPPAELAPEPRPSEATRATPAPVRAPAFAPAPRATSEANEWPAPLDDTPMDLTGAAFTLHQAVGGGATGIGQGGAQSPQPGPQPSSADVQRSELVEANSLSRGPKPPDLSGKLEETYPSRARSLGSRGRATLTLVVSADGRAGSLVIRDASAAEFGEACRRAVTGSLWSAPLDKEGHAVATRVGYTCIFEIR